MASKPESLVFNGVRFGGFRKEVLKKFLAKKVITIDDFGKKNAHLKFRDFRKHLDLAFIPYELKGWCEYRWEIKKKKVDLDELFNNKVEWKTRG